MGVVKVLLGHKKREVIEKMLDFVEGRITVYEFWDIYKKNDIFKQIVKKKEKFLIQVKIIIILNQKKLT